jgi:hypothetical protein
MAIEWYSIFKPSTVLRTFLLSLNIYWVYPSDLRFSTNMVMWCLVQRKWYKKKQQKNKKQKRKTKYTKTLFFSFTTKPPSEGILLLPLYTEAHIYCHSKKKNNAHFKLFMMLKKRVIVDFFLNNRLKLSGSW